MDLRESEVKMIEAIQEAHPVAPWSYDGEETFKNRYGRLFSDAINCFGLNSKGIAEALHSTPEGIENMNALAGCWLKTLAGQNEARSYDGRNEYSVKTGVKLAEDSGVKKLIDEQAAFDPYGRAGKRDKDYTFAMYASDYMGREHRTLQQSFSGIIFRYLKLLFPDLTVNGSETWERCPMI